MMRSLQACLSREQRSHFLCSSHSLGIGPRQLLQLHALQLPSVDDRLAMPGVSRSNSGFTANAASTTSQARIEALISGE
jgi:hypothetical protein